jgi:DNA-binding transcriptional ArsR family regulator
MATLDLLLHPVRLRIVRAVLDGHPLTTSQLRARIPDVSTATMYRQVALLTEAGVLEVVHERRVRGAVERTYRLHREGVQLDAAALAAMTPDDHRRAFTAFVGALLADFDSYLVAGRLDPATDLVSYRQAALWLSDEEAATLLGEVRAAIDARQDHDPGPGRRRRLLTTIALPADPLGTDEPPAGDPAAEVGRRDRHRRPPGAAAGG